MSAPGSIETRGILRKHPWLASMGALLLLTLWGAGFWLYNDRMDAAAENDLECFDSTFSDRERKRRGTLVEIPGEAPPLEVAFGQGRGVARDHVSLATVPRMPRRLEVSATPLDGERGSIARKFVHGRVKVYGDDLVVDLCLDAREIDHINSGEYEGQLVITDKRVAAVSVPVMVEVQARYLWLLAPFVLLLPYLGLVLVWQSVTQAGKKERYGRGALVTYITAVGATGTAFAAQGLRDPSWGGAEAAFAIIATMYAAAAGATASLGGPGGAVGQDNADAV